MIRRAHIGTAIAVDREGRVHFVDTIRNRHWRINPSGRLTVVASNCHTGDLFVDPDGNVSYQERARPPDEAALALVRRAGAGPLADVATDDSGNVYGADHENRRVVKITPEARILILARSRLPWFPTGVTAAGGDVYVLERRFPYPRFPPTPAFVADVLGGPRVRKIASDGTVTVVATVASLKTRFAALALLVLVVAALTWWISSRRAAPR